jgi:PAS domain S-box-containing protein
MQQLYPNHNGKRSESTGGESFEDYYRILFDSIDSGFCVIQLIFDNAAKPVDYRFLIVNQAFERQTGLKDAAGKLMRDLVPDHEQHWFDFYGRVALTGEAVSFEEHASGMGRWYDVYAFRVDDPEYHHVAVLFDDITAKKRVEDDLKHSMDQLNETNARLSETNRKLEESNRRLDDFVYIVSHDLKEPVRGIQHLSSFLFEDYGDRLDDQGKDYVRTLQSFSALMNDMISDLLQYSRMSRTEVRPENLDLNQMLKEILELMKFQLEKENVQVSTDNPLPPVYCSKAHLAEIFRNLIVNGIKYNDSNQKKIKIGFVDKHEKHPRGHVFYVKDNGIGIPEKNRDKIFKMFKRLHKQDQYGGGTGLGLAIVKNLVEQHHGEIWVEPNPEGGSIFYFYTDCA